MNDFYTYAWLREDGTPYYIGKGKNKRAWRKGSPNKSRVLILKKDLLESEAFKHEAYMIAVFGRKDLGTGILHNFTDGGEGSSGWICSDETKQKISVSKRGKPGVPHTAETIRKIINSNTGKKRSSQTRAKVAASRLGKSLSKETKQKLSIANSGKNCSAVTREKIAKANRERKHSEESKLKRSKALKGVAQPRTTCPHCGKIGSITNMKRWHFDNCKSCHTT